MSFDSIDPRFMDNLFLKHTDGAPKSLEDFLEKDLYKEQVFAMLKQFLEDSKYFEGFRLYETKTYVAIVPVNGTLVLKDRLASTEDIHCLVSEDSLATLPVYEGYGQYVEKGDTAWIIGSKPIVIFGDVDCTEGDLGAYWNAPLPEEGNEWYSVTVEDTEEGSVLSAKGKTILVNQNIYITGEWKTKG